jgi:hypothetical protein
MDNLTTADNVVVDNVTTTESPASSQVENVTQQSTEQTTQQTTNTDNVADVSTTKAFSERLKESTQKAIDAEYSRLYGAEYGIHTKADYEAAIAKQRQAEEAERLGIDPEAIKPFFEQWKQSDPDFQELNSIRQANNVNKALTELNAELKDIGLDLQLKDLSDEEVAKIPNADKVTEYVQNGYTLADAVFLANKKDFFAKQQQQAQQDTIKKIAANGASSPGSVVSGISADDHISFEVFEANKKDQGWVTKNFKQIMKSRAKW